MIEKIVLDHLDAALSVPVYAESQKPDRGAYCVVEKTGSGELDMLYDSLVAVKSYGATRYEAAGLNEQVKTAMKTLIERDEVTDCVLNTDFPDEDPATGRYRYQAVFNINHY